MINDEYIYTTITLKSNCSLNNYHITLLISDIIDEYGLTLADNSIDISVQDSFIIKFGISLKDDADTIGSCISEINRVINDKINRNYPEDN